MKETLTRFAEQIYSGNDTKNILNELYNIFTENEMYHEAAACLEKIWHITKEHELYIQIGDIFKDKLRNPQVGHMAYNRYLMFSQSDFYIKYTNALVKLNDNNFSTDIDNEDYSREIIKLCDKFDVIIYIMLCLHKNKEYSAILQIFEYFDKTLQDIDNYKQEHPFEDYTCTNDIENTKHHLVEILSTTKHHYDINRLAIMLDSECYPAYINILADIVTNKNYDEALNFYNNEICIKFSKPQKNSVTEICWILSDYYRDNFEFYNAVLFQKIALELDLAAAGE